MTTRRGFFVQLAATVAAASGLEAARPKPANPCAVLNAEIVDFEFTDNPEWWSEWLKNNPPPEWPSSPRNA